MANENLHNAKRAKNDEFYTQLSVIENELKYYTDFFKGKVVYCNCDDPLESNFTKYFILRFHDLGLKKLICTFYDIQNTKLAYAFEYKGEDLNGDGRITSKDIDIIRTLKAFHTPLVDDEGFDYNTKEECWAKGIYGKGDFRSKHCRLYLAESDVVVTNPPFSLFREYVEQLMDYQKKFLIIGNINAITYKEIFPYIKNNTLWLGCSLKATKCNFIVPTSYEGANVFIEDNIRYGKVNNAVWFTNITHEKRQTTLHLYYQYNETDYPKYDNYDAIEVEKIVKIPTEYDGIMGVPITFLLSYCPTQFDIIGLMSGAKGENLTNGNDGRAKFYVNGKGVYARLLIKLKK